MIIGSVGRWFGRLVVAGRLVGGFSKTPYFDSFKCRPGTVFLAQFDQMPFGSQTNHQYFILLPDFVVYYNLPEPNNRCMKFTSYPLFPFSDTESYIKSIVDDQKL